VSYFTGVFAKKKSENHFFPNDQSLSSWPASACAANQRGEKNWPKFFFRNDFSIFSRQKMQVIENSTPRLRKRFFDKSRSL
jgi:hypothetical protein